MASTVPTGMDAVTVGVPAHLLRRNSLHSTGLREEDGALLATTTPTGVVLNYNLYAQHSTRGDARTTGLNAWTEFRVPQPMGVFSHTMLSQWQSGRMASGVAHTRLDSSWRTDFPESALSFTLGDTVTSAQSWSRPVRLGGLRVGTDFGLQPYRSTSPVAMLQGQVTQPSKVDARGLHAVGRSDQSGGYAMQMMGLRSMVWPGLVLCAGFGGAVPPASAQSCWVAGSLGMSFGTVSAVNATDTQTSLSFTCGSNSTPLHVRMCLNIGAGSPVPDVNPRRMTNYNGSFLQYNFYSDPMRTQIIGPQGGGYTEYTWTMQIPGSGGYAQASGTMPVYGRVFAGQGSAASGSYQSQLPDVQLRYAFGTGSAPLSCSGGGTVAIGSPGISASVPSGCRIMAISHLDFGTLSAPLSSTHDQSASVALQCPAGTQWQVDLGSGNHHASARRMASGSGYVAYQLYRNAARTQLWGSTVGGGTVSGTSTGALTTVPIYGRIPIQGGVTTGVYTDTVILTLSY